MSASTGAPSDASESESTGTPGEEEMLEVVMRLQQRAQEEAARIAFARRGELGEDSGNVMDDNSTASTTPSTDSGNNSDSTGDPMDVSNSSNTGAPGNSCASNVHEDPWDSSNDFENNSLSELEPLLENSDLSMLDNDISYVLKFILYVGLRLYRYIKNLY